MSRTAALGFSSLQSVCTNPYSIYRGPPFCKPPRLRACAPAYAEEPRHESPRHRRKNRRIVSPRAPFPQISKPALDHARRQGDISQLAYLVMGGRDPAIAFLNGENVVLGGRPLAIATASPEGYVQVVEIIRSGASVPEST